MILVHSLCSSSSSSTTSSFRVGALRTELERASVNCCRRSLESVVWSLIGGLVIRGDPFCWRSAWKFVSSFDEVAVGSLLSRNSSFGSLNATFGSLNASGGEANSGDFISPAWLSLRYLGINVLDQEKIKMANTNSQSLVFLLLLKKR